MLIVIGRGSREGGCMADEEHVLPQTVQTTSVYIEAATPYV